MRYKIMSLESNTKPAGDESDINHCSAEEMPNVQ